MMRFGELALIILIVLIIFGAGKLPNVMSDLGKGMNAFKKGMKDDDANNGAGAPPQKEDDMPPPSAI